MRRTWSTWRVAPTQARGRSIRLVPTWSSLFGAEMAGDVLLPRPGARIAPTSFDQWLATQG